MARDEVRIGVLERVEEDPVRAEPADHVRELVGVLAAAPGAGVPRVVVDEHAHSGIPERGGRLDGSPGTS